MFHYDLTQEDGRIVATEHRVPLTGDALELVLTYNKADGIARPLNVHDGTFDVLHVDSYKGGNHTVNLTHEELAAIIYLAMVGDDVAPEFYDKPEVKRYQELMKDHPRAQFHTVRAPGRVTPPGVV